MDEFEKMPCQEPPKLWETPIRRISWGLALIGIGLSFFGLDVILHAVGVVLLWLGLRPLRRTKGGFRFAYVCATVFALLYMTSTVLQATPLAASGRIGEGWSRAYYLLRTLVLQSALTLTAAGLWLGLKRAFSDAGQALPTAAAGGLVIVEALLIPLAFMGLSGWPIVGPLLLLFILLIVKLYKLGKSLDRAGCALTPAPARLSSGVALGLWLGIPLAAITVFMTIFSRLPVHEQRPVYGPDGNRALRAELIELGFPQDILIKLPDGELSRFQGAYGLTVKAGEDTPGSHPDGIPSVDMLEVSVRDDKYGFRAVYLAHLSWSAEEISDGGYMEGLRVTPDRQGVTVHTSCPEGRLEWRDKTGTACTAPLSFDLRSDSSGAPSYYADFSLPKGAEGAVEGWVCWESTPARPQLSAVYNYQLAFAHRLTPWQYPYRLPSDVIHMSGGGRDRLGWRISFRGLYSGQLAPEGQYVSGAY